MGNKCSVLCGSYTVESAVVDNREKLEEEDEGTDVDNPMQSVPTESAEAEDDTSNVNGSSATALADVPPVDDLSDRHDTDSKEKKKKTSIFTRVRRSIRSRRRTMAEVRDVYEVKDCNDGGETPAVKQDVDVPLPVEAEAADSNESIKEDNEEVKEEMKCEDLEEQNVLELPVPELPNNELAVVEESSEEGDKHSVNSDLDVEEYKMVQEGNRKLDELSDRYILPTDVPTRVIRSNVEDLSVDSRLTTRRRRPPSRFGIKDELLLSYRDVNREMPSAFSTMAQADNDSELMEEIGMLNRYRQLKLKDNMNEMAKRRERNRRLKLRMKQQHNQTLMEPKGVLEDVLESVDEEE
ncbi:uncharacterized protein [Antedon mediterranea]|uniref:uncharacterized protein n=1 Tax=Antedon mediterranea TaxID=105859 RepID=UPI003AF747A6